MNLRYYIVILCVFFGMLYVLRWGAYALSRKWWVQGAHGLLVVLLFYSLPFTSHLVTKNECFRLDGVAYFASILFGIAFYLTLGFILLDLTRIIVRFVAWWVMSLDSVVEQFRIHGAQTVWVIAILITSYGLWCAHHPKIQEYDIVIPDPLQPLKVVFIADVHIGIEMHGQRLTEMVNKINALSPDIILLGGDIVDETPEYITSIHALEPLRALKSTLGTYAITGNHEYYRGVDASVRLMEDVGIDVLRDEARVINGNFILVGREDITRTTVFGEKRIPISVLLDKTPHNLPILLMDHQPIESSIKESESTGVDLQLSGHTHGGQLWPINYIMSALYEDVGNTARANGLHLVVTSGYGTVGPAIRVDATPEIVLIHLRGTTTPPTQEQKPEAPVSPSTAAN